MWTRGLLPQHIVVETCVKLGGTGDVEGGLTMPTRNSTDDDNNQCQPSGDWQHGGGSEAMKIYLHFIMLEGGREQRV